MVEILDETRRLPSADAAVLERALQALLEELGLGAREVSVVLLDDAAIRVRNREDRGVDAATDVLSYPTHEPDDVGMPEIPHLGDILISLDTAARQGAERGHAPLEELLVLAAHGLTHLRGLDHPTEDEWTPFRDAQRRILHLADPARWT